MSEATPPALTAPRTVPRTAPDGPDPAGGADGGPERRLALLAGIAALPLAAGALLPAGAVEDGPTICLTRHILGLPCPFCGATRAFIEFGHGSAGWITSYNGFWVLVSLVTLVLSLLGLAASRRAPWLGRSIASRLDGLLQSQAATLLLLALLAAPGWAWALVNRSTIT